MAAIAKVSPGRASRPMLRALAGRAVSASLATHWVANLAIGQLFLPALGAFGVSAVYLFFAAVCAATVAFTSSQVVETKARTLKSCMWQVSPAWKPFSLTSSLSTCFLPACAQPPSPSPSAKSLGPRRMPSFLACKTPLAPACVSVVCIYSAGVRVAATAFTSSRVVKPRRLPCLCYA